MNDVAGFAFIAIANYLTDPENWSIVENNNDNEWDEWNVSLFQRLNAQEFRNTHGKNEEGNSKVK